MPPRKHRDKVSDTANDAGDAPIESGRATRGSKRKMEELIDSDAEDEKPVKSRKATTKRGKPKVDASDNSMEVEEESSSSKEQRQNNLQPPANTHSDTDAADAHSKDANVNMHVENELEQNVDIVDGSKSNFVSNNASSASFKEKAIAKKTRVNHDSDSDDAHPTPPVAARTVSASKLPHGGRPSKIHVLDTPITAAPPEKVVVAKPSKGAASSPSATAAANAAEPVFMPITMAELKQMHRTDTSTTSNDNQRSFKEYRQQFVHEIEHRVEECKLLNIARYALSTTVDEDPSTWHPSIAQLVIQIKRNRKPNDSQQQGYAYAGSFFVPCNNDLRQQVSDATNGAEQKEEKFSVYNSKSDPYAHNEINTLHTAWQLAETMNDDRIKQSNAAKAVLQTDNKLKPNSIQATIDAVRFWGIRDYKQLGETIFKKKEHEQQLELQRLAAEGRARDALAKEKRANEMMPPPRPPPPSAPAVAKMMKNQMVPRQIKTQQIQQQQRERLQPPPPPVQIAPGLSSSQQWYAPPVSSGSSSRDRARSPPPFLQAPALQDRTVHDRLGPRSATSDAGSREGSVRRSSRDRHDTDRRYENNSYSKKRSRSRTPPPPKSYEKQQHADKHRNNDDKYPPHSSQHQQSYKPRPRSRSRSQSRDGYKHRNDDRDHGSVGSGSHSSKHHQRRDDSRDRQRCYDKKDSSYNNKRYPSDSQDRGSEHGNGNGKSSGNYGNNHSSYRR